MKIKKTWVGYIFWGLFSIVLFTNIGFAAVPLIQNEVSKFSVVLTILIVYSSVIVSSVLIICGYQLFMKFFYPRLFTEASEPSAEKSFVELMVFLLCVFVAISFRVLMIITIREFDPAEDLYYALSIGEVSYSSLQTVSNGVFIYNSFLNFLYGIFGISPLVIVSIHSVLHLGAILLTYQGVRMAFGKLTGFVFLVCLSVFPVNYGLVNTISPIHLLIFLFGLYLFILFSYLSKIKQNKGNNFISIIVYIILGLFSAFMVYYDIVGIISVFIGLPFLIYSSSSTDDMDEETKRPITRIILYLLSFVFGTVILLALFSKNGLTGIDALLSYILQFVHSNGLNFELLVPNAGSWECIPIFVLVFIWFLSYLRGKSDNGIPFVVSIIVIFLFTFLSLNTYAYQGIYNFLWAIMAGLGISALPVFVVAEAEREHDKRAREAKRAERALKRSMEAGEKSIQLNSEDITKRKKPAASFDNNGVRKGYGIGRKSSESESAPDTEQISKENKFETEFSESETKSTTPKNSVLLSSSVEKTIHEPVKSMVSQVPTLNRETKKPAEDEKKILPPNIHSNISYDKTNNSEINIMNQVPVTQTPSASEDKMQQLNDTTETDTSSKPSVNTNISADTDLNTITQNNIIKRSAPIRRGYRTPSKSTFSPEELERIKQHTNGEFAYHSKEEMMSVGGVSHSSEKVLKNNFIHVIPDSRPIQENKTQTNVETNTSLKEVTQTASEQMPKLIKNPLPVPKPHVAKELNFDFDPKENEMDYDIKDLSGRDYFDI